MMPMQTPPMGRLPPMMVPQQPPTQQQPQMQPPQPQQPQQVPMPMPAPSAHQTSVLAPTAPPEQASNGRKRLQNRSLANRSHGEDSEESPDTRLEDIMAATETAWRLTNAPTARAEQESDVSDDEMEAVEAVEQEPRLEAF